MRIALVAGGLACFAAAAPASAQMDHSMHGMAMPGMTMPAPPPARAKPKPAAPKRAAKPAAKRSPATVAATIPTEPAAEDPHAGHDMSAMPGMVPAPADPHAGHEMPAMAQATSPLSGTNLPAGDAPAPAPRPGLAADRYWGRAAMAAADARMRRDHGGMTVRQIMFNLAEVQVRGGRDGYRWDGEGWIGGDIDRLTIKTEGSGDFGRAVAAAEVQALYSRAVDPYWNLQAGVRYDVMPNPSHAYATVGIEGLAPYWFDVEAALFLSDRGDLLARAEAWYDGRVTQYLVLQPRAEANLAAQDVPANGIGSGLSNLELGLRLRYEKSREFAPYVGVSWDRKLGDTARYAGAAGEGAGGFSFVAGVRAWF